MREESLHRAALGLGLPQVLRLSEGETRGGGAQRASILADALEALIGAAFLDGGFDAAQQVVRNLFGELIDSTEIDSWSKDAKTELQEWLQARRLAVPSYRIVATRGQAHAQTFEVECLVAPLGLAERGEGRSRRAAEQQAARRMLDVLKAKVVDSDPDPDHGDLIELSLPGLPEPGLFLRAYCKRNGLIVEGVPRTSDIDGKPIKTVRAAQAWSFGKAEADFQYPDFVS